MLNRKFKGLNFCAGDEVTIQDFVFSLIVDFHQKYKYIV